jgi:hypothetical protein
VPDRHTIMPWLEPCLGILHLHHWIAEITNTGLSTPGLSETVCKTSGIISLVLDSVTDGSGAVIELRLHNTALLSLKALPHGCSHSILVPHYITQRHLSPGLLTIDKSLIIMQSYGVSTNQINPWDFWYGVREVIVAARHGNTTS